MTKDEALKLALEAIEGVLDDSPKVLEASITGGLYEVVQCRDAITAIKEALAQPEHDYKDLYEKEKRRSAMWLSKYEEVAGPAPKAIPMAQPEQDGQCKLCTDGCPACDARKLPEQEPVAWLHRFIEGGISIGLKPEDLKRHPERWEPLYTYPPQQELVCVCGAVWEGQELVETPPEPRPCPTCEALARTVMLDQTAHDTPPQRTWVGLTDEEAMQICVDCGCLSEDWLTLLDAIEAKLKEKNT